MANSNLTSPLYWGYSKYYAKGKRSESWALLPFGSLNQLYAWWFACKADEKLMLKNISVQVDVKEVYADNTPGQQIEVIHGAPPDTKAPDIQGPASPVGTNEAAQQPKKPETA